MQRIAVDTNTILDTLLERSSERIFLSLRNAAKERTIALYIPFIVFFEVEWVLRSFYKKEKSFIVRLFRSILATKNLESTDIPLLMRTVDCFEKESISFVDSYILEEIKDKQIDTLQTEDKKLKKLFTE